MLLSLVVGVHEVNSQCAGLKYEMVEALMTAEIIAYGQYMGEDGETGNGKFMVCITYVTA